MPLYMPLYRTSPLKQHTCRLEKEHILGGSPLHIEKLTVKNL